MKLPLSSVFSLSLGAGSQVCHDHFQRGENVFDFGACLIDDSGSGVWKDFDCVDESGLAQWLDYVDFA